MSPPEPTLKAIAAAALLVSCAGFAQQESLQTPVTPAQAITETRSAAMKAYSDGNFASYLAHVRALRDMLPNHPAIDLRLAAALARTGHPDDAFALLDTIAAMGVTVDLAADARNAQDFASIATDPRFDAWQRRTAANAGPIVHSTVWHRFADAGLVTEDVSENPKDHSFYVSSVLKHKIVRVDARGAETGFPLEAPESGWNVSGVQVDAKRGVLWVSAQALRGFPGIADADAGKSRLSAYGLKSKRRLYTHEFVPEPDRQIAIGDLALTPAGDVLAMDSQGGKVYRVAADRRSLDGLNRPFLSPQDAAISEDGKAAFIADYQRGIARIDLNTGDHEWLLADRSIALSGIDGLYSYRGGLIAIQNGVQPERILFCGLDGDGRRITHCKVLERGEPLGEPTHGVVIGDAFVYLANSGWNKLDEHGKPRAGETLTAPELRRLPLPR